MKFENGIWRSRVTPLTEEHYQFGELCMNQMKKKSHLVGQIDSTTGFEDTYGNMLERTIRCALWLKKQGVKPGDIISVNSSDGVDAIIPVLATFMLGATVSLWWANSVSDILEGLTKTYRSKIVFVEKDKIQLLSETAKKNNNNTLKFVSFQDIDGYLTFNEILSNQDGDEVLNFRCTKIESPDQLALILQTSGSTGVPKGVMHGYKSLLNLDLFPLTPDTRENISPALSLSTFGWVAKTITHLTAVAAGVTVVNYNYAVGPHPFDVIEKYKVRWVFIFAGIALKLQADFDRMRSDLSSVKYANTGGTFLSDYNFRQFVGMFPNARVFYSYGMTEVAFRISIASYPMKSGSAGKILDNVQMKIINEDGSTVVEPRKGGEICLKSHKLFLGYFKNVTATTAALDSEGWYHTGDVGHFDDDGEIHVTDRLRDLIKTPRSQISPIAIERIINEHPGVAENAVVGKFESGIEKAIAFIVKKSDANVVKDDVITTVVERFPVLPQVGAVFVTSLPRTASGKVDKCSLRELSRTLSCNTGLDGI